MSPAVRFYAYADGRSLGLFRVVLGLLLCIDLLSRVGVIEALYTNEGVLTNHFALYRPVERNHLSLLHAFSALRDVRVALAVVFAVYLLFAVGYRTRLTSVLALVAVVSLHARNLLAVTPSDGVLHAWMWWAVLLPVGQRFAVDNVLRGALAAPRAGELEPEPERTRVLLRPSLAAMGALLWFAALHTALTLSRSGPLWREGAALGYALRDPAWSTALGTAMAGDSASSTLRALSYAGWLMPLLIAVLVLVPSRRVRLVALVCTMLHHLAWSLLFRDGLAGWAMCAGAPLLLGPEHWERWNRWRVRPRASLLVVYDADCGVCFVICRILRRLDVHERLRFLPNDGPLPASVPPETLASSVVVLAEGALPLTKSAACAAIVGALPGGRAASWLMRRPAVARLADAVYDAFAVRRARVSQWLGFDACGVQLASAAATSPTRGSSVGAWAGRAMSEAGAIALATLCGHALLQAAQRPPDAYVSPLDAATRYVGLSPLRDRLAPDPPRSVGVLVVDGVTPSGAHLDPLTKRPPRTSPLMAPEGPGHPAMLAYFARVSEGRHAVYLDGLRDYVKRVAQAPDLPAPVSAFEIVWMSSPLRHTDDGLVVADEPVRVRLGAYP